MRFKEELEGKEVIDKDGNTLGVVEDVEISKKGEVEELVMLPKGIVSRLTRRKKIVEFGDIQTFSNVVLLKKDKDELKGEHRCKKCGKVFDSERGLKIHIGKEHKK